MDVSKMLRKLTRVSQRGGQVNNSGGGGKSSGTNMSYIILGVLGVVVVGLLIYFATTALLPSSDDALVMVKGPVHTAAKDKKGDPHSVLVQDKLSSLVNSYSGWIYIDNYVHGYQVKKHILQRGDFMNLYLENNMNTLVFEYLMTPFSGSSNSRFKCEVPNIPLQTWVNFAVVMNSRNIDIYINGRLEKSCVMNGVPLAATTATPIEFHYPIDRTFMGKISKLYYYSRNLTPNEVYNNYAKGPFPDTTFSL